MIKFPAYRGGGWRESLRDRQIKNLFKKKSPSDFDHIKVGRRICRVGGGSYYYNTDRLRKVGKTFYRR